MPAADSRVFLSYARTDGEEFATELRLRLERDHPEITLWQDRAQLEGGAGWWRQIERAIDRVKFLVVVMTPAAMASEITAREWRYARQKGVIVYPVKGVPDGQLDYGSLPRWMRKAHFFDLAKEWDTFANYLKSDRQPHRVPFMAPQLPSNFVKRPQEFDQLVEHVLQPERKEPVAITTALHGAGGYGKTTLAAALCHDLRVIDTFDDGILWVSLGQTPNVLDELTKLHDALATEAKTFLDIPTASRALAGRLEHLNCLIVVDDVWEPAHLEPFLAGGPKCVRLVTSRKLELAGKARVLVDEMSTAQSADLLRAEFAGAAVDETRLTALSRQLGEWPLLLNLAAGMLRKRLLRGDTPDGALDYAEKAFERRGVTAFDRSESGSRVDAVRRTVAASRDLLSQQDQRRLRELAIFPEETAIPLGVLERLWGLDDFDTQECAQGLADVALITLDLGKGEIALHDVMRDYLLHELSDPAPVHAALVSALGEPAKVSGDYAFRWLPYHMALAGQHDALRRLLLDVAWLESKAAAVGARALLADFDLAPADRDLETLAGALRLAMPAVVEDARQLPEQLWSRIPEKRSSVLDGVRVQARSSAKTPVLRERFPNLMSPGAGLIQTLTGHTFVVNGALVLADGQLLSWSGDETLRVWNVATGEGRALTGHTEGVNGALVLADGQLLSWSDDGTLRVWNAATGEGRALSGHTSAVNGALVLPDKRLLSWSVDGTLRVWNAATGEGLELMGHTRSVDGALVLPDGQPLSWSGDGTLRVWDLATGEGRVLTGHTGPVHGALVLPDRQLVSWSHDGTLLVWNLATGEARALPGHTGPVSGALMLPDGQLLSWGDDGTLRVWTLATGEGRALTGHTGPVYGALGLPDGQLLSWSADETLRVWSVATGEGRALTGHKQWVNAALVLPDGQLVSWSPDGTLRVWNVATGEGRALTGHTGSVDGALVLPDGQLLSWSDDGTLRLWNLATREGRALTGHTGPVRDALVLLDGQLLSWSDGGTLRLWNVATGEGRELTGHTGSVDGALVLVDGQLLSWSDDGTLRVWNVVTGEGRELTGHTNRVRGALVLPDGQLLSWSFDETLRVWNVATGEGRALTGHTRPVAGALVLPDGQLLSWGYDRTLRLWNVATGEGRVLTGHTGPVRGVLVLPDGQLLSWSDDGTMRVWNVATGEGRPLTGHTGPVSGALALPDGQLLSWSDDGMLQLWAGQTPRCAFRFDAAPAAVVPCGESQFFVGDSLGRVHFMELIESRV